MKQNYFVYNNEKYNSGTTIVLRVFSCASRSLCDTNATFLYFDTETNKYVVDIYGRTHEYTEEIFYNMLRRIPVERNNIIKEDHAQKTHTAKDELNIDGLLIAWMWYIFIMAIAFIFYDRIGLWILTSIVFFSYRNKKLKEEGYK
jgi:hypothetical protein